MDANRVTQQLRRDTEISGGSRKQERGVPIKLLSAKRDELNPRKFWGYAHSGAVKLAILSQGKSHLRLRGTAANSQLASLG